MINSSKKGRCVPKYAMLSVYTNCDYKKQNRHYQMEILTQFSRELGLFTLFSRNPTTKGVILCQIRSFPRMKLQQKNLFREFHIS